MISVIGGVYEERCLRPEWDQVYGSAGRAAALLGAHQDGVRLYTYCSSNQVRERLENLACVSNFLPVVTTSRDRVRFYYTHCLSRPHIVPNRADIQQEKPLSITDDIVVRFGMMEGDAIVNAKIAVYDPQSMVNPQRFRANGSRADRLAIIANRHEIFLLTGMQEPMAGAKMLLADEDAEVVVVKCGSDGVIVVTKDAITSSPAYFSELVWTIGSGDCFVGAFAQAWAVERMPPAQAADAASRIVSRCSESQSVSRISIQEAFNLKLQAVQKKPGKVYLAAPFFSLSERWLVEEARSALLDFGLEVFSPVHDVGYGNGTDVAPLDLAGIHDCDRLLALLPGGDPGTIFEVGYAVAQGIPIIAYAEQVTVEHLKMLEGTACFIAKDFASALHHTCWLSRPPSP